MEEISIQPNVESGAYLLIFNFMELCSEKEQTGQKEMQNAQFEVKKSTRKINGGVKASAEGEALFDKENRAIN